MADKVFVLDKGTVFETTVYDEATPLIPMDLSGGVLSAMEVVFRKPGGDALLRTLVFPSTGNGSDGVLQYKFVDDELNEEGVWRFQIHLTFADDTEFWGTIGSFRARKMLT
jgi:hypothetical protein